MSIKKKAKHIFVELKGHAPFTFLGAILGIVFMFFMRNVGAVGSSALFSIFHPAHVILSAMVTASMFSLHIMKKRFLLVFAVGYFGSIGIATFSDIIIPHLGSDLLGLNIPSHAEVHHDETPSTDRHEADIEHEDNEHSGGHMHFGFIEEWYIVNPAAVLGILIAYFLPHTKLPHTGHVLISTWASSSYLLMSIQSEMTIAVAMGVFATLFIATWLPCCVSDIVFPLLFVKSDIELAGSCPAHSLHSHPHVHKGA